MSMDEGSIIKFLKRLPTGSTCPNALMQSVQSISISQDAYDAIMIRSKNLPKTRWSIAICLVLMMIVRRQHATPIHLSTFCVLRLGQTELIYYALSISNHSILYNTLYWYGK